MYFTLHNWIYFLWTDWFYLSDDKSILHSLQFMANSIVEILVLFVGILSLRSVWFIILIIYGMLFPVRTILIQ